MASERSRARACAVAGCLVLAPSLAPAQPRDPREEARRLGREGVRLENAGDWAAAHRTFRAAYRLVPAPTLALREARALVRLRRLVDAAEAYARAAGAPLGPTSPPAFRTAVQEAKTELEALRSRIPRVLITMERPELAVDVHLDGFFVPVHMLGVERAVDPGEHVVETRTAATRTTQSFVLREGETRDLVLYIDGTMRVKRRDEVEPPPALRPAQIAGFVTIGVGVSALAAGVVAGATALDAKNDFAAACAGARCSPHAAGDLRTFHTMTTAATIAFAAGSLATAAGAGMIAWDALTARPTASTRIAAWMSPTGGGVRGTF